MTQPTDTQIALLIKARNKITDVMVHDSISIDTSDIDALLSAVPAGYDNAVDLLLGRSCAKLPDRPGYFSSQDATLAEIADMIARCDEQRIDRDTNAGMCN
jgi:hypothetical protein